VSEQDEQDEQDEGAASNVGLARTILEQQRSMDPEVLGRTASRGLRGAKERELVLDWHRRYAAEADRLFRAMRSKAVTDPEPAQKVAQAVAAKAWNVLVATSDLDVILFACRVCAPEDVVHGMVRLFMVCQVPLADSLDWLQETARFETRWCAAFNRSDAAP